MLFCALCFLFTISAAGLLFSVNSLFLIDVPKRGGQFTEGVIGSPRFINPVLAVSQTDHDIAALVYSGLLRVSSDGSLIPDLAESFEVSENGSEYVFLLKEGLVWHDGKPLTAEDVKFTIEKIQDPGTRSLKRGNWEGVVAEAKDERTIVFTLPAPYAPFLENATVGILPKHLFGSLSPEDFSASSLNTHPIGSGPYRLDTVKQDVTGIPEYYDFVSFHAFSLGEPYIEQVRIQFYANEEELSAAFQNGKIDAASAISPAKAVMLEESSNAFLHKAPLPRVFGIFFNHNEQEIFTDKAVRRALDKSLNKNTIVHDILLGFGTVLNGPFPPGSFGFESGMAESPVLFAPNGEHLAEARGILEEEGWTYSDEKKVWEKKTSDGTKTLEFSLSTSNVPELKLVAEAAVRDWTSLGAKVALKVFESGELNQSVIRPRKYDALLFGEIVGRSPDPYAFWHSSQRLDPGLNISLYANASADKALVELRETRDEDERILLAGEFESMLRDDTPAIFLYAPQYLYLASPRIKNISLPPIMNPSERYARIFEWYTETEKVWKIFTP